MKISLEGKKALVCGSTRGIGKAIAHSLADCGALVICMSRDEQALKEVVAALPGDGHDFLVADFSKFETVQRHRNEIIKEEFHILINNTGGPPPGPVAEADWEDFERAISMHLKVSHHLSTWVLEAMMKNDYGRIINIISTSVKMPIPGLGVSNTVRGAMASWSKTLSNEVAGFGVTVNNILPGPISTDRLDSIVKSQARKKDISVQEAVDEMKSSVPAGRFGEPWELAALAAFLASPLAGFINGTNIPVDGGRIGAI